MRINEINIGKEHINDGLEPIIMNKLNQFVLIVGKNGSGKSRLLSIITRILSQKPKEIDIHTAPAKIISHENDLKNFQNSLESLKRQQQLNPSQTNYISSQIIQHETTINHYLEQKKTIK